MSLNINNTNLHFKDRAYDLLGEMRASIISMDLPYSQTIKLLNQILMIEKAIDNIKLDGGFTNES